MNTTSKPIRTRFAPSPTGFVHIGSLRTALFSFLYARANQGVHILRVEDTDQNRLVEGAIENLIRVMKHMGVEFDEGYYLDDQNRLSQRGDHGPYIQSERLAIYHTYIQQLLDAGKAYYCFCTEERLADLRKEQTALKKPPMYDKLCKNLSRETIADKLEAFNQKGIRPVVRFAVPSEGETVVADLIHGRITYKNSVLDDQVILKSDGFPTYHLAVVVDDHLMEVTHVIRGEEWLPSTPKHILLYQAFGWEPTQFAHLPLILNPDKSKLSKRQGDVSVEDFLKKGYLKEALVNFVAFLGWNPKTEQEIFSIEDLISQFDLSKVNKSGAVFDSNKLDWMNGKYIRTKSDSELAAVLTPYWIEAGLLEQQSTDLIIPKLHNTRASQEYLDAITALEKERLKKLSEIGERTSYFFTSIDYAPELLVWKKSDKEKTKHILADLKEILIATDDSNFTTEHLEAQIKEYITTHDTDNGSVLWPLRTALTGLQASPGPYDVTRVLHLGLGKQIILDRLDLALSKL